MSFVMNPLLSSIFNRANWLVVSTRYYSDRHSVSPVRLDPFISGNLALTEIDGWRFICHNSPIDCELLVATVQLPVDMSVAVSFD